MNVYYVQREKIMVDISGSIMEFHCTKIWIRHQSFADLQKIENCHKEHASIGDALRAELCQTMKAKLCQNSTSALTAAPQCPSDSGSVKGPRSPEVKTKREKGLIL